MEKDPMMKRRLEDYDRELSENLRREQCLEIEWLRGFVAPLEDSMSRYELWKYVGEMAGKDLVETELDDLIYQVRKHLKWILEEEGSGENPPPRDMMEEI